MEWSRRGRLGGGTAQEPPTWSPFAVGVMAALRAPNGDYAARPGEATRMAVALRRSALPPAVSAPSARPRQRCRGPAPMTGLRIGRTVSQPVQAGRAPRRGHAGFPFLG